MGANVAVVQTLAMGVAGRALASFCSFGLASRAENETNARDGLSSSSNQIHSREECHSFTALLRMAPKGLGDEEWVVILEYCGFGIRAAFEFYSGIGGMAAAIESSRIGLSVAKAYDINIHANATYEHNFHLKPNTQSIEHLSLRDVDAKARLWVMSPPCQPFTRAGKKKDIEDNRTKSFVHLLDLLQRMKTPPDYFLLENVKGFDTSIVRSLMLKALQARGFFVAEYMLQPKQFGIPNTRLRYYCLARRTRSFGKDVKENCRLKYSLPAFDSVTPKTVNLGTFLRGAGLRPRKAEDWKSYLIPKRVLDRCLGYRFDVAAPWHADTSCFTKAYGSKHVKGTGPIRSVREWNEYDGKCDRSCCGPRATERIDQFRTVDSNEEFAFFTPEEALLLHGFPETYRFPSHLSNRQAWACIGNSLNVVVVSNLLQELMGMI